MNAHDIFISYSRKNLDEVKSIKNELEGMGFDCWMDLEGIESGSWEFSDHIIAAIDASTAMLFFLSADSQTSEWALNEIDYARDENKHVVLVRFNDDSLTKKFRFGFKRADVIDWRKPEQREKLLGDLRCWTKGKEWESGRGRFSPPNPSLAESTAMPRENNGSPSAETTTALPGSVDPREEEAPNQRENAMNPVLRFFRNIIRFPGRFVSSLVAGPATPTRRIDLSHDVSAEVNGLDSRDFSIAAEKLLDDMLASGALDKPGGGRIVLAIGRVVNRTLQFIDVDQLVKKIRIALLRTGKVVVTTAVSAGGAEDDMRRIVRDLANDGVFDTETVAQAGTAIAPEISLSGTIIERNLRINASMQRIEYIFQLSITEIHSGLAIWEGEEFIGKIGRR